MKQKIIGLVLLVTIIVASGIFVLSKSQETMTGAQGMLQAELSAALGSLVTVGQVEITSANTVTIHDITIYDKQAEPLLDSEKITVTYSLLSLVRGQAVVDAISAVTVEKPTLWLTRSNNGYWNIEDLLNKEDTTKNTFAGKVQIHDGSAIMNSTGIKWTLEKINARMDFAQQPSVDLQLEADHNGAAITAQGTMNSQGRSNLTIGASELLVADYQALLPQGPLNLVGGSIKDLEVTVNQQEGNIDWAGHTNLAGVDIDIDSMPLRQVQGYMEFNNKKVYVFAIGNYLEQPLDVRGSIRLDTTEPILNLTVVSSDFDPSVIAKDIPIDGNLAFKANITGMATNPIIDGDATLATGQISGYWAHNAQVNLQVMDKQLFIHKFTAEMLGGQVAATGTYLPDSGSYDLHLQAQQIDIATVVTEMTPNTHGDIDVFVKGAGTFQDANIQGTAAIGQGEISGLKFSALDVQFYQHNGIIMVDYANISLAQGLLSAQGLIDHQNIDLTVYGQGISLQHIALSPTGLVEGNGDFAGRITGTIAEPEFAGAFTVKNGQIFDQPFTQAKGNIHLNRQQLLIDDIQVVDGVTKHQVQGTLGLEGQYEMNLRVKTEQARAENLIKLLMPGETLTGNVDNEMILTGPLANFNAQGDLQLTDGSFRGQLIAKAHGHYSREQGTTTISQFSINSLNTRIKLSGSISPTNELNIDIVAQHINLERINLHLPYRAMGVAQFTGKLTGTANTPVFAGQLSADKLIFNEQEITTVSGEITLKGNDVEIPYISFKQGNGKFGFTGAFDMATNGIYGSLDVENAKLQPILTVFKIPCKDINGQLDGQIKVNGTLDKPNIWLTGTLKEGKIKQYPVESIVIDVALENNILKINDLSVTQGTGRLVARGTADLNGPIALEVGGRDIDAGLVAALLNSTVEPSGKMGFAAQISGLASNPQAAVSLEIVNGGVGSTTFDSLYGLLILDKKTIHVNQVLLKKGLYQASAYGIIPVAALSPTGRKNTNIADQMDLKLRLDNANLSIIPFLTKQVSWAEGATQGEVDVAGTLENPIITGNITVNNGVMKLAALTNPIQKMGVDISFEGDTINIKKFDGHMGKGLYNLTGTAKINGLGLSNYDLSLVLEKPEVGSEYFTGAIEGKLNFSNRGSKPTLSGSLLFENDIINVPIIPEMAASNLDIGLDVEMTVGKKVRFYNPYLYDILAAGRVNFSGSTREPDITGSIVGVRGTINYLGTSFKVSESSLDFRQFSSFEPSIKLSANTSLQQVKVTLAVNGPVSAIQFKLTSEPTMSQQEILSLLTLRSRYTEKQSSGNSGGLGRDEVYGVIGAGLQMQFVSQVEGNFRTALGLDEFRLVKDTTSTTVKKSYSSSGESTTVSQEVYNIEMSKYLTDKLLLSYTMGVNHDKRDLALSYSLNKRSSINVSIDEEQRTWFGLETRLKF